jgi:hypothetical protein
VCRALAAQPPPGNDPGRLRVVVHTGPAPAEPMTQDHRLVLAKIEVDASDDPAIAAYEPPSDPALGSCFTQSVAGARGRLEVSAAVDFDAAGKPAKTHLTETAGTLSPDERLCLERAFLAVKAPCPTRPTSTATARLRVDFALE